MQRILIIGAGFAGMHAALSAARLRDLQGISPEALEIAVIAPAPSLVMRPRLYEPEPETLAAPLGELFGTVDVRFVQGKVDTIDTVAASIAYTAGDGRQQTLSYDRLVLAAGSQLFRPEVPGLAQHGFAVDTQAEAVALDRHLRGLAGRPISAARSTVVVCGGGFTGVEVATEMPTRLRAILGADAPVRVIIVDSNASVAADLGAPARPTIEKAIRQLGVQTRLGLRVTAMDAGGATLSDGERIEASTVIWTAGMRSNPLTAQIPGERDNFGRLLVDRDLRVPGVAKVFATGDTAKAASDDVGNFALMSCQHANRLGAFAGRNAAAELLGVPTEAYHQKVYVCCLDLGEPGAVFTRGWDRKVEMVDEKAKLMKREINTVWIYPPKGDRAAIFAAAEAVRLNDY